MRASGAPGPAGSDGGSLEHLRHSLVRAIQSASPLPAPPDPAVFTQSLNLELEAEPYAPGHGSDGFEGLVMEGGEVANATSVAP